MKNKLLKICMILTILMIHSIAILNYAVFAALPPSNNQIFNGMDVSNFQGDIDYSKVKNSGIDFVYIKASEGTSIIDPYFRRNYDMAKENDLKVGFYHFIRARNEEQAKNEADFFASVIAGTNPDGRLAMDFEIFGDLTLEEINKISFAFLERLQSITNKECVIYSDASNAKNIFSKELADTYPLWIAEYDVEEPTDNVNWSSWVGFQYTDRGRVDGINGDVDLDKYTEDILLENNEEIPNPPPSPEPTPNPNPDPENSIYYIVKRGDTLSEIALWYNTTVEELVRLNNIQNPNLIFIGQKILISDDPDKENEVVYTVVKGDTLWKISNRYGVNLNKIVEINRIKNPNLIFPGQKIIIPLEESSNEQSIVYYRVKRGDTLWAISRRYGTTINRIARINGIRNPSRIYVGQILKIY